MTDKKIDNKIQNNIRNSFINYVSNTLLGPGSEEGSLNPEEEVISESPTERYLTGILYSNNDSSIEEGSLDDELKTIIDNDFSPKTLGLTFHIPKTTEEIELIFNTAVYTKEQRLYIEFPEDELESLLTGMHNLSSNFKYLNVLKNESKLSLEEEYVKQFHKDYRIKINQSDWKDSNNKVFLKYLKKLYSYSIKGAFIRSSIPINKTINPQKLNAGLTTKIIEIDDEHKVKVTILKQELLKVEKQPVSLTVAIENIGTNNLYQSQLEVKSSGFFIATEDIKNTANSNLKSFDDLQNELLYHSQKTYAVGHSIAVEWDEETLPPSAIRTTYLPTYEIKPMRFDIPSLKGTGVFNAINYVNPDDNSMFEKLYLFLNKYEEWIYNKNSEVLNLPTHLQEVGAENMEKCLESLNRMKNTITLLENNEDARIIFCLTHEAMILQRENSLKVKENSYKSKSYNKDTLVWRPFQLAFILSSFESIINEDSEYRDKLDLVWVSTGGGKTEAYLFAIASTIFNRRLIHNDNYEGTAVIMRYTLRLLTSQQFERASSLIVACEYIRINSSLDLGDEAISIGLWVGSNTTPNKNSDANNQINKIRLAARAKRNPSSISSFQIVKCPWCLEEESIFKKMEDGNYKYGFQNAGRHNNFHNIYCLNNNCTFNKSRFLPIHVVDENIFRFKPTLLFGTVDKFAQIAFKEETKKLFGSDNDSSRPPELIIQDELHLISGPLGSVVGLYEAIFDFALSHDNVKPKYIASTATIRNASEQVRALFNREVLQFPPPGLSASDNFFVYEDYQNPGRKYVGIMGTGKSQVTSEIRLLSLLLLAVNNLNLNENEKELYWTQTGYFNSIRELGKMTTLLDDDIMSYLKVLDNRNLGNERSIKRKVELTSRVKSSDIRGTLSKLEVPYTPKNNKAIDVLTATNMLSVGIDISRLNSMFVVGQPKQTAEYIQATSRVGRSDLGLIFTVYNAARSRDRSHYETFQSYHSSLYKFVEPSSVTPFATPSLDKALGAVIVSMLMHYNQKNENPNSILSEEVENVKEYLIRRISETDTDDLFLDDAKAAVEKECSNIIALIESSSDIAYYISKNNSKRPPERKYLLKNYSVKANSEAYTAMNSMREIEDNAYLQIIERED